MSESTCWVCMGSGSTGLGFWQECQRCFGTGSVDREPTQEETQDAEEAYTWSDGLSDDEFLMTCTKDHESV